VNITILFIAVSDLDIISDTLIDGCRVSEFVLFTDIIMAEVTYFFHYFDTRKRYRGD
jgi:hypothetical protein